MRNLYRYIFFSIITLSLAVFSIECIEAVERGQRASQFAAENEYLSVSLPETLFACPVSGTTVPVCQNAGNVSGVNWLFRLQSSLKFFYSTLWSNKTGFFYQGALCRQHELSSPFYCTPPSRYYVFALRRLII